MVKHCIISPQTWTRGGAAIQAAARPGGRGLHQDQRTSQPPSHPASPWSHDLEGTDRKKREVVKWGGATYTVELNKADKSHLFTLLVQFQNYLLKMLVCSWNRYHNQLNTAMWTIHTCTCTNADTHKYVHTHTHTQGYVHTTLHTQGYTYTHTHRGMCTRHYTHRVHIHTQGYMHTTLHTQGYVHITHTGVCAHDTTHTSTCKEAHAHTYEHTYPQPLSIEVHTWTSQTLFTHRGDSD